jgi:hypothetical protein
MPVLNEKRKNTNRVKSLVHRLTLTSYAAMQLREGLVGELLPFDSYSQFDNLQTNTNDFQNRRKLTDDFELISQLGKPSKR